MADPPVGVTVIVPLVFVLSPVTFTATVSVLLVAPLTDEEPLSVSQVWLLLAVYATAGPAVAVTFSDCVGGLTPMAVVKFKGDGVAVTVLTLNVTLTVSGLFCTLPALEAIVIVPV